MRVALVCSTLSWRAGGILPIMQGHAVALAALGMEITAHGGEDANEGCDTDGWGAVTRVLSRSHLAPFAYAPGLTRGLAKAAPDIVHQHGLWQYPSIAVSAWRRLTGRPVVISTQGMLEPWALRNSALKKRIASFVFERSNLRRAACIHCSANEVAGVRSYGLKNPIAVIPNGVNLPSPVKPTSRPSWLGPADRRTLLFLGRIHPKKGIAELLQAWSKLASEPVAADWHLLVAGWDDGGHLAALQRQAEELGIADRVAFPGPLFGEQKVQAFASATAFILPSFSEGLPMAVLEAWSYRLPVLLTRECNLPEGFTAGAAMEVTAESTQLAQRLRDLMTMSEAERGSMGEAGRRLIEERFTWERVAADLHEVYTWVLGGGPPPACVMTD